MTTRPRRSCLSVPGSSPKMVAKAPSLAADEIFFDLEDSVAPDRKDEARTNVVEALRRADFGDRGVGVRINGLTSPWWEADVTEVVGAGGRLDFVTIPKVEEPEEVVAVENALREAESARGASGPVGIQVQIESALGLTNVDPIAAVSGRLQALIFGPADMAASLGMPALSAGRLMSDYPGDHFHFAMSRILVAARAAALQAIDGPHLAIADLEGCRRGALRARALGYDGKWVVHPSQIDVVNEAFTPTREEYDRAVDILTAYERATREGRGAVRLGEEMIDEASRKMAARLVARGRAAWGNAAT
jgi:citrate lyase subunit beta/citryl-CoA lyase